MAKRIQKPQGAPAATPAPQAQETASDLTVLHPERELTLGGEAVVVREYGNLEWLRLLTRAEPLVGAIAAALQSEQTIAYEQALAVIADHADALLPLVAQAVDRDVQWIDQLEGDEVELLLMTWWGVNAHFFVRRAVNRLAVAQSEELARAQARAGARSTQP